jgi:hypothetical protein
MASHVVARNARTGLSNETEAHHGCATEKDDPASPPVDGVGAQPRFTA